MACTHQLATATAVRCLVFLCDSTLRARPSSAALARAQDQPRMYGGLLALRVLARKYEFKDSVGLEILRVHLAAS